METNPLSVTSFAIIFSHPVGCLFILFIVCFAVQKLLSLSRSHLFIFAFISIILGDESKKMLLWFMSESVMNNLIASKQTTHSKNGQKTWIDISPKKTYRWPIDMWKGAQHCCLLEKCKSKLPYTSQNGYHQKIHKQ